MNLNLEEFEVGKEILRLVRLNLNEFKRVDGDDREDANQHFYEEVFSPSIMSRLEELLGTKFPQWGTMYEDCLFGGKYPKHYGKKNNKYVPVGLRWSTGHDEWHKTGHSAAAKRIRTKEGDVYRPQIVVTSKCDFYKKIKENKKYTIKAGKGDKLNGKAIENHPKWPQVILEPLQIHIPTPIPINMNFSNAELFRTQIYTHKNSRFHKDDNNGHTFEQLEAAKIVEDEVANLIKTTIQACKKEPWYVG